MNKKIKKDWIKALRSGDYTQCKGKLRDGNSYCCLGVLCEILQGEQDVPKRKGNRYGVEDMVLPTSVVVVADLPDTTAQVTVDGHVTCLSELNDNGKTFSEIADVIEELL